MVKGDFVEYSMVKGDFGEYSMLKEILMTKF